MNISDIRKKFLRSLPVGRNITGRPVVFEKTNVSFDPCIVFNRKWKKEEKYQMTYTNGELCLPGIFSLLMVSRVPQLNHQTQHLYDLRQPEICWPSRMSKTRKAKFNRYKANAFRVNRDLPADSARCKDCFFYIKLTKICHASMYCKWKPQYMKNNITTIIQIFE